MEEQVINISSTEHTLLSQELKDNIEKLEKYHQIEILRIIKSFSTVKTNENKNGIFINLSEVPYDCLKKLEDYLTYVHTQEKDFTDIENKKIEIKSSLNNS